MDPRCLAGRSRLESRRAISCRWFCPGMTRRRSTAMGTARTRSSSPAAPHSGKAARARRRRRRNQQSASCRAHRQHGRSEPGLEPGRLLRHRGALGHESEHHQGRADPERGGQPARAQPEPSLRHVVQAWDATSGAGVPAYPRATDDFQLLASPLSRTSAARGPDDRRSTAPACTSFTPTDLTARARRLAQVHRRLDAGNPRGRRRRRRR